MGARAGRGRRLLNLVAFVVIGAAGRLSGPTPPAAFVGAWLMVSAIVVAGAAGSVATVQHDRTRA